MKKLLFSGIPTLHLEEKDGKIINSYTGFTDNVKQKIDDLFKN